MLRRAIGLSGSARAALRGAVIVILLASPAVAHAQSFTLPKECQHGATGAEGDDPVVLLVDNYLNQWVDNFTLVRISGPPVIEWGITISPFRGGISGYNIFTTYTPFLTSSAFVSAPGNEPSRNVTLPRAGDMTVGRKTVVWDNFTVTIHTKSGSQIVPYAYVDFIPDFVGSSPLTIQADANGQIVLFCVQQNFDGYNITVYDQNHAYLYDGSFPASGSLAATAEGTVGSQTRPHPDEPE